MAMRISLTTQILGAMILGAAVGWLWPSGAVSLQILATIFIRLVLVVIAPLMFSTLVVGIAGQGSLRKLGSLALQTFALFLLVTLLALGIAFVLANTIQPGRDVPAALTAAPAGIAAPPADSFWIRLFPQSIIDAMARGDVLQIVVFSVLFAIAVSAGGAAAAPVLEWCRSLTQIMYKFTDLVMRAAPIGVFGAVAALVGKQGLMAGAGFLKFIGAVYLGLALLLLVCFPLLALISRIPLRRLVQAAKEPFAISFATASGTAALPKALERMEEMGVPRSVASFAIGTGLNFNASGSTLFIGLASLFILQAFRIPHTFGDQMLLMGTLFVTSKGIAAVPRASLVVIAAALPAIGLPPEVAGAGVGLLLGIDPLTDMPRTAVNSAGHCLAAALVARWQGSLPDK
jgi:proton glutamate symport protein